jgi:hypothetical protein
MTRTEERLTETQADKIYYEGRFDAAAAAYSQLLQDDPSNLSVLERLGLIALWKNKPADALIYFKKAREASRFRRFWPMSIELQARMATAYYRMDNFPEAVQHFKSASGPFGMFGTFNALGKWLAVFGKAKPYVIEGPAETRLEFVVTDPLPVVKVSVAGGAPVNFLIDTGGSEVILDKQLAASAGVRAVASLEGQFAGSKTAKVWLAKLDRLQLGTLTVKNVPVQILDMRAMSSVINGIKIDGVIGTRLLMHFLATIDYRGGALVLRRATPDNYARFQRRVQAHGAKQIPFWLVETHYIMAMGTANDTSRSLFFVDTGLAGIAFVPFETTLRKAGIKIDWSNAIEGTGGGGKVKTVSTTISKLTLGSGANELVAHNAPISVLEKAPLAEDQFGFNVGGMISHQFFRKHALTFDFKTMKMIVQ